MKIQRFILVLLTISLFAACCSDKTKEECMSDYNLKDTCICPDSGCELPAPGLNGSGLPWGFVTLDDATTATRCSAYTTSPPMAVRGIKIQPHLLNYLLCTEKATSITLNLGKDANDSIWPIYTYQTAMGLWKNLAEDPTDSIPEVKCPPTCIPPR